jgi:RNA polymerase sigma factor (sigma-70 family)
VKEQMETNTKIVGSPEDIITSNLGLVWKAVNKYRGWLKSVHGVDKDDLYSTGCIGLIKAYEQYDPDKGSIAFSNYAFRRICTTINRFIYDYNENLSYPRNAREAYYKMFKNNMLDCEPEDIKEKLNMKMVDIKGGLEYHKWKFVSTSSPLLDKNGTEEATVEDMLISINDLESNINIKEIFDMMSNKEKQILYLYFYKDYTKTEIASRVGVSQPHVGRIMKKISQLVKQYQEVI